MDLLKGKTVLVTGASRGVGKGIAVALGKAGANVYLSGRTHQGAPGIQGLEGSIEETANSIHKDNGKAIAIGCDHTNDSDVAKIFEQIHTTENQLDILVNNVWGGYESMFNEKGEYVWEKPFWEQDIRQWDLMFQAGVRAHYTASRYAAQMMVTQKSGLIVNISHFAAQQYSGNVCYGVAKAATDKLATDMAHELKKHNIAVVSLYPGLVRTERVMRAAEFLDLSNSESPEYIGRVIAALYIDPNIMDNSGKVLIAAQLGAEYNITDIDGKTPVPLSFND